MWDAPAVELGYQFTYDDTSERNPFYYAPEQFRAHEAICTVQGAPFARLARLGSPLRGLTATAAVGLGVGREKETDQEFQSSVSGGLQWLVADRFSLFARVARSEAARFESVQGSAGMSFRF
jgi:hypothetical protein